MSEVKALVQENSKPSLVKEFDCLPVDKAHITCYDFRVVKTGVGQNDRRSSFLCRPHPV